MSTQQKQKSAQKSAKKPISNYLEKISENLNANSNLKKAISEINSLIKAADCLKNEYEIYVIDQNNSASKVALEICPSAKQNNNIQKSQSKQVSPSANQQNNNKLSAQAKSAKNNNSKQVSQQASKVVANAKQNNAKQQLKEVAAQQNTKNIKQDNKANQPLVSALKKAAAKLSPLSKEQQNNKKSVNQNQNNAKLNQNQSQQNQNNKKALLLGKTVQSKIINKASANSVNKKNNNKIKSK